MIVTVTIGGWIGMTMRAIIGVERRLLVRTMPIQKEISLHRILDLM